LLCASVLPPMLTVSNLGPYPIASRYLALATAGLGVALASLCAKQSSIRNIALHALACAFGVATWLSIPTWRDQEAFVEQSLAQRPTDPRLHYMRGSLLLERAQQGDSASAQRADQSLLEAKRLLGDDLARNYHLAALRRDVATALAWMSMFYASPSGGPDWLRVERAFSSVIADWPDRADAYVGLGVARAASGRLELGQRDLERAIELDPGTPAAYFNLAKVLRMRGDLAGARARLLEALRIRPDDSKARAMLDDVERQLRAR
jgi:tetratricopeptide (TPR) repeat protein